MFEYELPSGGLYTETYYDSENKIRFSPTINNLRHTTTIRIIEDERWNHHFKKVADFGCCEMSLVALLKNTKNIEHVLMIDIDEDTLERNKQKAAPLISDYISKRQSCFRTEVLCGDISIFDRRLCDTDVVIGLEIIEHLYPGTLEEVPECIFGCVKPKLAIFSTPNSDFNILFDSLLPNGFRHYDHKFEWTREEFNNWCLQICSRYTNYEFATLGVGKAPVTYPDIGEVTQMAIFARKDILTNGGNNKIIKSPVTRNPVDVYKEVAVNVFPVEVDDRSTAEKIISEAQYTIHSGQFNQMYFNEEMQVWKIPMKKLFEYGETISCNEADILEILRSSKEFVIEENSYFIIRLNEPDVYEDDSNLDTSTENNDYFSMNNSSDEACD